MAGHTKQFSPFGDVKSSVIGRGNAVAFPCAGDAGNL